MVQFVKISTINCLYFHNKFSRHIGLLFFNQNNSIYELWLSKQILQLIRIQMKPNWFNLPLKWLKYINLKSEIGLSPSWTWYFINNLVLQKRKEPICRHGRWACFLGFTILRKKPMVRHDMRQHLLLTIKWQEKEMVKRDWNSWSN